jgi:DNA-directed RNA polymerase subunit M/transcription elongation factor TFIIS
MRFCTNCENVLYTALDEENGNNLVYYCRHCGNKDEPMVNGETVIVMDTQLQKTQMNFSSFVNEYTKFDKTLPRLYKKCPNDNCPTNRGSSASSSASASSTSATEGGAGAPHVAETLFLRYDNNELKYLYMCVVCDVTYTN